MFELEDGFEIYKYTMNLMFCLWQFMIYGLFFFRFFETVLLFFFFCDINIIIVLRLLLSLLVPDIFLFIYLYF